MTDPNCPKRPPKMDTHNHYTYRVLSSVGGVLLSAAIIAWVLHWGRHDIHQDHNSKRVQSHEWWLEWWRMHAKPEFDELKQMLKERDAEHGK